MTLGNHYLNEDVAKRVITIPIAAASIDAWIEDVLTLIDGRINFRCKFSTNSTSALNKAGLASVELNSLLKVLQNTRLSREGVPAEISFIDSYFSAEDKFMMQDLREKNKFTVKAYQSWSEL